MQGKYWLFAAVTLLLCSWYTHTTTARIDTPKAVVNPAIPTLQKDAARAQKSKKHQVPELETLSYEMSHSIQSGDTLGGIFRQRGFDLALAHNIARHPLAKKLTKLSVGKELKITTNLDNEVTAIKYPVSALYKLNVDARGSNVNSAYIEEVENQIKRQQVSAEIQSSLYEAAKVAGLDNSLIMEMVRIFGWDIDFVQDIRQGDHFHVVFEQHVDTNGTALTSGNIIAASFTTQGDTHTAIRFTDNKGNENYYKPNGESMLGTFLRAPVEFSRISSRFGRRKHPILKKWRAHRGVDYAARRGTPIRATADGSIISAGRKGGYGNTVVVNHAGRISTLYAHMTGFAKGVRQGKRVKQGQTIGYIGSSGLATGPHLHYEFRVDGVHRNPLTYKTPKASKVHFESLPRFANSSRLWTQRLDQIERHYQIAKAETEFFQGSAQ